MLHGGLGKIKIKYLNFFNRKTLFHKNQRLFMKYLETLKGYSSVNFESFANAPGRIQDFEVTKSFFQNFCAIFELILTRGGVKTFEDYSAMSVLSLFSV